MKKFEKDNNVKLNYILYTIFKKDESAAKKENSAEKPDRSRSRSLSKLKVKKTRVSDLHVSIGHDRRPHSFGDDDKREARTKWEKINIKKDHLAKFTQKDKKYRVL